MFFLPDPLTFRPPKLYKQVGPEYYKWLSSSLRAFLASKYAIHRFFFEEIVRSCEGRFLILRSWLYSFTCLYYTIPRKLSRKLNFISVLGSWEKDRKFYTLLFLTWNSQLLMISGMQNVPQISCYRVYLEISVFDCCSRIGALWKVLKDLTYIAQLLYKISLVYFRFLKWIQ